VNESVAKDLIAISREFDVDARIVGYVEPNTSKKLTIKSEYGTFVY